MVELTELLSLAQRQPKYKHIFEFGSW